VSGPDPTQRGPGPVPGVRFAPMEVLDLARRSGLYIQGSDTFPWWSGPTVDILEYIVFSGHVAAPEPSTWWGRMLFTTRLEITAWAPCLHAVVRGTLFRGTDRFIQDCQELTYFRRFISRRKLLWPLKFSCKMKFKGCLACLLDFFAVQQN
jgi:hypothetical protein